MKDFIARLSSRKFLITVGGIIAVTLYPEQGQLIVGLIVTYLGAEGAGDVVKRYQEGKTNTATVELTKTGVETGIVTELNVDKNRLVPGDNSEDPKVVPINDFRPTQSS